MTAAFIYALISIFIVSFISLIGIFALFLRERFLHSSITFLVSLAIGALFGDAIIHLIPEAIKDFGGNTTIAAFWILVGILLFFILEKVLRWRHSHGMEDTHSNTESVIAAHGGVQPVGRLILFSDGFHNFLDGIIIGTSYLISIEVGIATTIAVILHEIPQEIGDFGILIHAGYNKWRALFLNFISALLAVVGTIAVFLLENIVGAIVPALIAIAAGSFIYIAGSDLVPELHSSNRIGQALSQLFAIVIGIGLMFALLLFG